MRLTAIVFFLTAATFARGRAMSNKCAIKLYSLTGAALSAFAQNDTSTECKICHELVPPVEEFLKSDRFLTMAEKVLDAITQCSKHDTVRSFTLSHCLLCSVLRVERMAEVPPARDQLLRITHILTASM